jgi:ubiquinone/menaquinone biosynthesis C-methylase UbiE
MDDIVNIAQAKAWNGYEGTHWADNADRYDATNSGFNAFLLDAAAIGIRDRVLDVGCGNGQVTRLAARRAAQGSATGVDLSAPMLARARATSAAEDVPNVSFEQGDAQVHPFPEGGFDVALSRFGIMFFADPVAAFANIARALRPGGRLAFVSLRDLSHHDLGTVYTAMAKHLPPPPAPTGPQPDSMADPARSTEILTAAGFTRIRTEPAEAFHVLGGDAAEAGEFLGAWGPIRFLLDQVDEATATRARAALTKALGAYQDPDAVRLRGAAWLVTAIRP